jgi:type IV pilus assembly protein PilM
MSRALSLDLTTAEQMKCDIKSVSTLYPDEGLPKIFQPTLLPMITELEYSMNLYTSQGDEQSPKTIEKIILTGGSSVLPALPAYFSSQLGTKTYVGDPWARVVYPEELRPVLDEIGPRYGVGIGLAMRDIE